MVLRDEAVHLILILYIDIDVPWTRASDRPTSNADRNVAMFDQV
jgi:hypothetical protein